MAEHLSGLSFKVGALGVNMRVNAKNSRSIDLVAKAQKIFQPYTLDINAIAWWPVYQIGQRMCDKFDDVLYPDLTHRTPRVFIALLANIRPKALKLALVFTQRRLFG